MISASQRWILSLILHIHTLFNMAKTPVPQEKTSKRSKGKGKVTKDPEVPKKDAPTDAGFSLFKSAASKDAELDDLFSKSVRVERISVRGGY